MKELVREIRRRGVRSVVAGVSGGADSVALLRMLVDAGIEVHAVHCNFHLRGDESNRDMKFVVDLCNRFNVPLTIAHFDVEAYKQAHHLSTETACRELRYEKFREVKQQCGADRIAVAHNADDQAETVLLNLMRGAGVSGLRGMLADTGEIIRPLLDTPRSRILEYLEEIGETFVTDSTNSASEYSRNFIRNEVIPLLESRWSSAKQSILRSASILREAEQDLDRTCDSAWQTRKWAKAHGANTRQCDEMISVLNAVPYQSGRFWLVRGGRIVAERSGLEFIANETLDAEIQIECQRLDSLPDIEHLGQEGDSVLYTTLPPESLRFRHPRTGDRIEPIGMKGSTLVSKVMKDAKLSQAEKEQTVVAEEIATGAIIWVAGLKRSRRHLLPPKTSGCANGCITRDKQSDENGVAYFAYRKTNSEN